MPKNNIDYSETVIYKIYCKNEAIKDLYVGHTTNFHVRKYQHKNSCNNSNIDLKIYNKIRENGGWTNWDMVEIAKYNCNNSTEARIKEQQHYEELKATLNSCPPYPNNLNYICSTCNLHCITSKQYNEHMNSFHIKKDNATQKIEKAWNNFICERCEFKCCKQSDWNRHILTAKHKKRIILKKYPPNYAEKSFSCQCGKVYKHMSTLCAHKKKCNNSLASNIYQGINIKDKDALLIHLLKQNSELQNKIIELTSLSK
jgi:hypothetical protein